MLLCLCHLLNYELLETEISFQDSIVPTSALYIVIIKWMYVKSNSGEVEQINTLDFFPLKTS